MSGFRVQVQGPSTPHPPCAHNPRVQGLEVRGWGAGFSVQGEGLREDHLHGALLLVLGVGFEVRGVMCIVYGVGCGVWG